MTTVETILKDIHQLPINDLKIIANEIQRKISVMEKVYAILSEYQGIGKGIWTIDAQEYVNQLRTEDRL